jgi:hypothetical protein
MIYFLQNETNYAVKIGFARDVKSRIRGLRTASPDRLRLVGAIPGERADEHRLHLELARFRGVGEWFRPEPELIEAVAGILKNHGGGRPWSPHVALLRPNA